MSKVKSSPKLIKEGKLSYEWARSHMQILDNTINRLKKSKPLKGVTIGFCLHVTKETSVLLIGAKELEKKRLEEIARLEEKIREHINNKD